MVELGSQPSFLHSQSPFHLSRPWLYTLYKSLINASLSDAKFSDYFLEELKGMAAVTEKWEKPVLYQDVRLFLFMPFFFHHSFIKIDFQLLLINVAYDLLASCSSCGLEGSNIRKGKSKKDLAPVHFHYS